MVEVDICNWCDYITIFWKMLDAFWNITSVTKFTGKDRIKTILNEKNSIICNNKKTFYLIECLRIIIKPS
jgi:hypothetical protein